MSKKVGHKIKVNVIVLGQVVTFVYLRQLITEDKQCNNKTKGMIERGSGSKKEPYQNKRFVLHKKTELRN